MTRSLLYSAVSGAEPDLRYSLHSEAECLGKANLFRLCLVGSARLGRGLTLRYLHPIPPEIKRSVAIIQRDRLQGNGRENLGHPLAVETRLFQRLLIDIN
jgi:hypothetical protein